MSPSEGLERHNQGGAGIQTLIVILTLKSKPEPKTPAAPRRWPPAGAALQQTDTVPLPALSSENKLAVPSPPSGAVAVGHLMNSRPDEQPPLARVARG